MMKKFKVSKTAGHIIIGQFDSSRNYNLATGMGCKNVACRLRGKCARAHSPIASGYTTYMEHKSKYDCFMDFNNLNMWKYSEKE